VLVEILVLVFFDLVFGTRPQRLHRVDRLDFTRDLAVLVRALGFHPDRPCDEVRVSLDDFSDLPAVGVVEELVVFVLRFEM
jgi:hypothetical protein